MNIWDLGKGMPGFLTVLCCYRQGNDLLCAFSFCKRGPGELGSLSIHRSRNEKCSFSTKVSGIVTYL